MTLFVAALILSYLLGSIPTALLVGYAKGGVDLRTQGSGNAGATNVYRVYGMKPYLFTLSVDMFKGFAAVAFVAPLGFGILTDQRTGLVCGAAAIVGHIWTIFARFKGGKGVATAAGVFLGLAPLPTVGAILVYLLVTLTTRYVSLGSMTAAVAAPGILLAQKLTGARVVTPELLVASMLVAALIVYTHRANIGRLFRGEEAKTDFLKRRKPETPPDA